MKATRRHFLQGAAAVAAPAIIGRSAPNGEAVDGRMKQTFAKTTAN